MIIPNILAAFAVAALAGMGVGGGGLYVVYLTSVLGIGQLEAQGVNLLFFIAASAASSIIHLRKRRPDIRTLATVAAIGAAASIPGASLAAACDPDTVRTVFGIMLILSGSAALFKKGGKKEKRQPDKK